MRAFIFKWTFDELGLQLDYFLGMWQVYTVEISTDRKVASILFLHIIPTKLKDLAHKITQKVFGKRGALHLAYWMGLA